MQERIVFSFGEDEYLPIITATGHGLKEKNVFICNSELLVNIKNYYVTHKKIIEKEMHIFLTYGNKNLIRGFLYFNGKECEIIDHRKYESLQIGEFCYGNINVIRLSENPFSE